jgi:arginase
LATENDKPAHCIRIYGVPMDLGQMRRGVDMGPSAIRYAGLHERLRRLAWEVCDGGNIPVPVAEEIVNQPLPKGQAHHAAAIAEVARTIHQYFVQTIDSNEIAVCLGGDHSMALGTVSAALRRPGKLGVLWVDAHGDFNTPETTPSGNVHGMVVSSLMGMGPTIFSIGDQRLQADQVVMIGIRDLDAEERIMLRESGIKVMTMREIDERGMAEVMHETLQHLRDATALHVSFDMDSLDPTVAPGVGTPVRGGLSYREAHLLMEMLADDRRVRSLDLVEVNPILDEHNTTAQVAVEMAASLFGQRII